MQVLIECIIVVMLRDENNQIILLSWIDTWIYQEHISQLSLAPIWGKLWWLFFIWCTVSEMLFIFLYLITQSSMNTLRTFVVHSCHSLPHIEGTEVYPFISERAFIHIHQNTTSEYSHLNPQKIKMSNTNLYLDREQEWSKIEEPF